MQLTLFLLPIKIPLHSLVKIHPFSSSLSQAWGVRIRKTYWTLRMKYYIAPALPPKLGLGLALSLLYFHLLSSLNLSVTWPSTPKYSLYLRRRCL